MRRTGDRAVARNKIPFDFDFVKYDTFIKNKYSIQRNDINMKNVNPMYCR